MSGENMIQLQRKMADVTAERDQWKEAAQTAAFTVSVLTEELSKLREQKPAAAPAVPEEWRELLAGLLAIAEKKGKKQGSPNHSHLRPGIWDDDNGPALSGKPCAECAMYDKARALLQSAPQSGSEPVAHHPV